MGFSLPSPVIKRKELNIQSWPDGTSLNSILYGTFSAAAHFKAELSSVQDINTETIKWTSTGNTNDAEKYCGCLIKQHQTEHAWIAVLRALAPNHLYKQKQKHWKRESSLHRIVSVVYEIKAGHDDENEFNTVYLMVAIRMTDDSDRYGSREN